MQRIKYMFLRVRVLRRGALLTAAENTNHDARKTFEILAAELLSALLKFVLRTTFHLLCLLWVFVWLLSSSGVQLALRGSAVRKPIWESHLALAGSTRCWNTCWQSCGSYLGSWQQFLVRLWGRCLKDVWLLPRADSRIGDVMVGVFVHLQWHSNCIFYSETQAWALHSALDVFMWRYSSGHGCLQSQAEAPCAQHAAACSLVELCQWGLPY